MVAGHRTPAERADLGEEPDGVVATPLAGADVVRLEERENFGPGQRLAAGQIVDGDLPGLLEDPNGEAELRLPGLHPGDEEPGAKVQYPVQLGRRNELQCGAHGPGTHDEAGVQRDIGGGGAGRAYAETHFDVGRS
jgi:hypothetical protein